MKKLSGLILYFILHGFAAQSQTLYFPPLTGNAWDTIAPQSLGWCQPRIDSLYAYLQVKNTKSFIVLKNGKIVLEKYFGTYTADSFFYWASASKSLASFITGVARQKGFININNKVSDYLGAGWSSEPLTKENLITVKNLLQMNSGMEDNPPPPCDNEDTAKACLLYKVDAGTRWAYHTGSYKKVQDVVSTSVGINYNAVTNNWIESKTGMSGVWISQTYYSKARDMARFGLLNLNKGIWNTDTVLNDAAYFNAMISSSQSNLAYGYLWWLNGKASYKLPGPQLTYNGSLIPNAPNDMFAALGKNDQKIYVVPGQGLVVIHQGNSAHNTTLASSEFDNSLWDYINKLSCAIVSINEAKKVGTVSVYPNPAGETLHILSDVEVNLVQITNALGVAQRVELVANVINTSHFEKGIYFLQVKLFNGKSVTRKIVLQ